MDITPTIALLHLSAGEIAEMHDQIVGVYYTAFSQPPYNESEYEASLFSENFSRHLEQDGFECVIAFDRQNGVVVGFGYGYPCLPGQWWHDTVVAAMPVRMRARWFEDTFELAELAVIPSAQGQGLGGKIHDQLLAGIQRQTAVLSTIDQETPALHLYRSRGWQTLLDGFRFPGVYDLFQILGLDLQPLVFGNPPDHA